jgi:hypothetical protein
MSVTGNCELLVGLQSSKCKKNHRDLTEAALSVVSSKKLEEKYILERDESLDSSAGIRRSTFSFVCRWVCLRLMCMRDGRCEGATLRSLRRLS